MGLHRVCTRLRGCKRSPFREGAAPPSERTHRARAHKGSLLPPRHARCVALDACHRRVLHAHALSRRPDLDAGRRITRAGSSHSHKQKLLGSDRRHAFSRAEPTVVCGRSEAQPFLGRTQYDSLFPPGIRISIARTTWAQQRGPTSISMPFHL